MTIIDQIAAFISDLLGCVEGDTECAAKARKYATWLVFIIILAIILLVAPYIIRIFKK